jgi:putative acetyltransferase
MIRLLRTDSVHPDFIRLVQELDTYLAVMDGSEHAFYAQYNLVDKIKHVVLAYTGNEAVGCGAIKEYIPAVIEVKRMYTNPEQRGKGIATAILRELESWAAEMNYSRCILETGKKQLEAIELYKRNSYILIPNYGQYEGMNNSLCFEKML